MGRHVPWARANGAGHRRGVRGSGRGFAGGAGIPAPPGGAGRRRGRPHPRRGQRLPRAPPARPGRRARRRRPSGPPLRFAVPPGAPARPAVAGRSRAGPDGPAPRCAAGARDGRRRRDPRRPLLWRPAGLDAGGRGAGPGRGAAAAGLSAPSSRPAGGVADRALRADPDADPVRARHPRPVRVTRRAGTGPVADPRTELVAVRGGHDLGYACSAPAEEDLSGRVRDALETLVRGAASRTA